MRILVVEDDAIEQEAFRRLAARETLPYEVEFAPTVAMARDLLRNHRWDLLILDYRLPDGSAFDVASAAEGLPWIIVTGEGDESVAAKALRAGARDYLVKDRHHSHFDLLPLSIDAATRQILIERQGQVLSHAVSSILDAVYITDIEGRIVFANPAFERLYGYSQHGLVGQNEAVLWAPSGSPAPASPHPDLQWSGEAIQFRKDGSEIPVWLSQSRLVDEAGRTTARVVVTRDVTERRRVEETLRRANAELEKSRQTLQELVGRDDLTGLFNRRELGRHFDEEAGRAERSGRPFSLVLIDIDHFKQVNDRYGHLAGDDVLRHIARELLRTLRFIDRPARIGGEEFAILLPETDGQGAVVAAERIRQAIAAAPCRTTGGHTSIEDINVTISAGIATFGSSARSFQDLLGQADRGLYRAKAEGRNRVCWKRAAVAA
jgi:two-component system, cell cycle response regulator